MTDNDSGKQVYAHLCTWFKTRPFSGHWEMWNSDYEQTPHDPDVIYDNGHRDIATPNYPLTDVYDTSDPDLIECHLLGMKLAGFDGVIVDWDGRRLNRYRHEALMDVVAHLEAFDMKLIVCFEEWCGYWPEGTYPDRRGEIDAARAEIDWLMDELAARPFYGSVRGTKPVLIFRKKPAQWFDPAEWSELAEGIRGRGGSVIWPASFQNEFDPVIDGRYFWVGGFTPEHRHNTLEWCRQAYQAFFDQCRSHTLGTDPPLVLGSATPGFDDTCVWGWGVAPRVAPRYQGERFKLTWEMSIENDVDLVQVVTWNDWNEGSHVEPADTFGYKYLQMNKRYAARFKGRQDVVPDEALHIPLALYRARKGPSGQADRAALDGIRDALLAGDYEAATAAAADLPADPAPS